MGSPRSFTFSDAGKGPSGKLSPEGVLFVPAKIFLVSLSWLLGPLQPGKAFLLFGQRTPHKKLRSNFTFLKRRLL